MKNLLLFLTIIVVFSFAYDFHHILFKRPASTHTWRQTDCASLALTYFQKDNKFFEPSLHNLLGNEGKTVGELPIIYFFVGKLYKIFGYNEIIFRIVNMLIFFIGLFYLFKLSYELLNSRFYALVVTALGFSSPVVNFYSISFLPDVPALSLTYIATYYFILFYKSKATRHYLLALFFITMAGLLKVTALIPLCVLACVWFFDNFYIKSENKKLKDISNKTILLVIIPFLVFGFWLLYSHSYQNLNNNHYFSLDWDPFWIESSQTNWAILKRLTQNWGWFPEFYWSITIYLSLFLFVYLLVIKKVVVHLKLILGFYFLGVFSFTLLYFSALNDHDYYSINLMPFFTVNFLIFFLVFKNHTFLNKPWFMILIAIFIFFNVQHNDRRMCYRYADPYSSAVGPFYGVSQDYLNSLGITPDKKVLYYGEESYCSALYLMNRYGWSKTYSGFNTLEDFNKYKKMGAEYLIILGEERLKDIPIPPNAILLDKFNETIYFYQL